MEAFIDSMKQGVIALLFIGMLAYLGIMVAYFVDHTLFVDIFGQKRAFTFGLPISAIAAFAITCVFEKLANPSDKLSFKAFGLEFSGPAAPATIWIICYLTLVGSMVMVKDFDRSALAAPAVTPASTAGIPR